LEALLKYSLPIEFNFAFSSNSKNQPLESSAEESPLCGDVLETCLPLKRSSGTDGLDTWTYSGKLKLSFAPPNPPNSDFNEADVDQQDQLKQLGRYRLWLCCYEPLDLQQPTIIFYFFLFFKQHSPSKEKASR
jgi:hypothetical protein